ncbi:MAG: hypothetical protein H6Q00_809 [Holophagaceae bacterium]|nr:hypothetical protein [Holophagaceae bacterium]
MDAGVREVGRRREWWFRSFRGRVLGALLIMGLLPVLILGGYSFFSERSRAVGMELARLSDQSQQLCVSIDKYIASNSTLVYHLALTAEVVSFMGEKNPSPARQQAMNAWLRQQCALDSDLDAIFVTRLDGLCTASSEPRFLGANYAFRSYFQDALARRARISDWQIGLRTQEPCIFAAQGVMREGKMIGVIVIRIGMTRVQKEVQARAADGKIAYLINADGIFLAHVRPDLDYSSIGPIPPRRLEAIKASRQFLGRDHPTLIKLNAESIQAVLQTAASGQAREFRYTNSGVARWVALRRLETEPWVVGVAVNESDIYTHSKRILFLTTLVCVLTLLLVLLGGIWFSRRVLLPLHGLEDTMERFGRGDSSARAGAVEGDEVGRLGLQFNAMADLIVEQTEALAQRVVTLEGILPICSSCRKIRNEDGAYQPLESYVASHTQAQFSHGLCEDCARKLYPDYYQGNKH